MKFEDSSNYQPTIDAAALVLFAMALKWRRVYNNSVENEEQVTKAKISIETNYESKVLSSKCVVKR